MAPHNSETRNPTPRGGAQLLHNKINDLQTGYKKMEGWKQKDSRTVSGRESLGCSAYATNIELILTGHRIAQRR